MASLNLRSRHPLIKAEVAISFQAGENLDSHGDLFIKIPFKNTMVFEFSGRDFFNKEFALQEFKFSGGEKYFGRWWAEGGVIRYKDHLRESTLSADKRPLLSPAAILFSVLQERSSEFSVVYVGASKLYEIDFVRSADAKTLQVYQSSSHDERKLAASLYLNEDFSIHGGEIYLPVLGKITFDLMSSEVVG